MEEDAAGELAALGAARAREIVAAVSAGGPGALLWPSRLEGWTRLTVVCHLRYGALASRRMTLDALGGRPTAYYPGGRAATRPSTLEPATGEEPADVVESLASAARALDGVWCRLGAAHWSMVAEENGPADLGPVTLARLALLRLTEVEVHGTDLDLGLGDWDPAFVTAALAARLDWLPTRRTNHRDLDERIQGTWLLVASDGPSRLLGVHGQAVTSEPAEPSTTAGAVIEGTSRDLLALLLGRETHRPLRIRGDRALADGFPRAFPGP